MAFITSDPRSPVPVVSLSMSQTARIRISWDILSLGAAAGRLRMSVDKGPFVRFDAAKESDPPIRSGTNKVLDVRLGSEYAFELRAAGTENLVAQYVVKTTEQDVLRLSDAIHIHIPAKQAVYQLQIEPGIESVRVHFRTRQPCAPILEVRDTANSNLVNARLGPNGTSHDFDLPLSLDPTAQNTSFELNIHATSSVDAIQPAPVHATFRTGTRAVEVKFDHVWVHDDGDPGFVLGDGDFVFDLGAGDIGRSGPFGRQSFSKSIGSGENRSIDVVVAANPAAEEIWVQASVRELDGVGTTFWSASDLSFAPEGVRQFSFDDGDGEKIIITKWFDLTTIDGEIPFTLDTGQRVFDLTINGRLRVQTQDGALLAPQIVRPERPIPAVDHVTYVDRGTRIRVGRETSLQRSLDGELHRIHRVENTRHERWSRLAEATAAPVTVVLGEHGPQMFSLDDKGTAVTLDKDSVTWRTIGGRFVGRLLAASGPDGPILVGLDQNGAVHQSRGDGEWRRVAEGVTEDLSVFASGDGIALVARGRGDEVMYRSDKDEAWQRLGSGPPGRLWAGATPGGPVFAVLRSDETLAVAVHGGASAPLDWREAGSINDLLDTRLSLAHFPKFPPARPPG